MTNLFFAYYFGGPVYDELTLLLWASDEVSHHGGSVWQT